MKPLALLLLILSCSVIAADKFLEYQYTPTVKIKISDIPCPIKEAVKEYPFTVVAMGINGSRMLGCYLVGVDEIEIRWQSGELRAFPTEKFQPFKPEL